MGREIAAITTFGTPKPGYFQQAFDIFQESLGLFETLKQEGKITSYEVFGLGTGDPELFNGLTIVKGPETTMYEVQNDPRVRAIMTKGALTVTHFSLNFAVFGEELLKLMVESQKAIKELELVPVG